RRRWHVGADSTYLGCVGLFFLSLGFTAIWLQKHGKHIKIPLKSSRNTAAWASGRNFPRDSTWHYTYPPEHLFHYGESPALLEHFANNDVADL
ncbi:hypothetical protein J5I95_07840, partial [Candidatus Poribacteria bacterium]|nr:hypothetical protein [Candidatus Poribacteria bacterium]